MTDFTYPCPTKRADRQINDKIFWAKTGLMMLLALKAPHAFGQDSPSVSHSGGSFDAEMLRQRGIDPRLAIYFSEAARFTPGAHEVKLTVNGAPRGRQTVRFDEQGQLCFDAALLKAAGLVISEQAEQSCTSFTADYPLAQVDLRPDVGEIDLLVPKEALRSKPRDTSGFSSGGVAGIVNYELLGMLNEFDDGSSSNNSANTEVGFNAGDWIVRSNQLYVSSAGEGKWTHQDAYAQRTFADLGTVFQGGQIQLANPVLGGAQITGVQLSSEGALSGQDTLARVEGLAVGPARVEVRQAGTLIYTTIVPGGPFVLTDVPRINQRAEVEVTVIEADGDRRTFSVSAAQAGVSNPANGYVFGVGQLRNIDGASSSPVVSLGWTGSAGTLSSLSGGLLASSDYNSVGASIGHQPWSGAQARVDLLTTRAAKEGVSGVQSRASLAQQIDESWSVSGAVTLQSEGYRELQEASWDQDMEGFTNQRNRSQVDAGVSYSHPYLGNFNLSYSEGQLFDGTSTRRGSVSWGTTIKRASVSVVAEYDLSSSNHSNDINNFDGSSGSSGSGNAVYATISVPFGERRRVRSSYRESNGSQRVGVSMTETVNDTFGYRVGSERNLTNNTNSITLGASLLPRYAQIDLGYSGDGDGQTTFTGGIRGGVVAHDGGVTASPYRVGDTFGVVSVGDVSGVKVNTPNGPVWTDYRGKAVAAQLGAYRNNALEVAPKSLPRNIDILNGAAESRSGRGAVERFDFEVAITRRVLLSITDASGKPIPAGTLIVDDQSRPVGSVEQGGQVFLPNITDLSSLWVESAEQPRCEVKFELPDRADTNAYYEMVPAKCEVQ